MVVYREKEGFTIAEMVVTLTVMSVFMALFFQTFFTYQSQRVSVIRLAAANNIAQTNLNKISAKTLIPSGTTACNSTGTSPNNPLANASATGSVIATNASSGVTTPTWTTASMAPETLATTSLPTETVQTLKVLYPQGCSSTMPVQIISTVTYGSETATHAAYIN